MKDYILGRNTNFDDRVTDNLWKLAGLSKFITWQVRREGLGAVAFKQIMPPFAFVNEAVIVKLETQRDLMMGNFVGMD